MFGKIEDIIKKEIPINKPMTILLLAFVFLIFPKIKGMAKNNIIVVERGFKIFSQNIFSWIDVSSLFVSR